MVEISAIEATPAAPVPTEPAPTVAEPVPAAPAETEAKTTPSANAEESLAPQAAPKTDEAVPAAAEDVQPTDGKAEAATPSPTPKKDYSKLKEQANATGAERDVGLVACAILAKTGNKLIEEGGGANLDKLKNSAKTHKGELITFAYLLRPDIQPTKLSEGLRIVQAEDGSFDIPKTATEGKSISQIYRREGNNFICDLGDGKEVAIPAETVLSAHVVTVFSTPEKIQEFVETKLFTQEEASVISAYVDSITGRNRESSKKIDKEVMEKLATSSGLVTADALKSFAELNKRKSAEAPAPDDKNEAFNKQIDEVIKTLEDRNIASPEDFSKVFQLVAPESIGLTITRIQTRITEAKERLEKAEEASPEEQKKIETEITNLTGLEKFFDGMKKIVAEQDLTTEFFSRMQIGETDPETTSSLDGALKDNSGERIIEILTKSKNIDEKDKKKIKKFPKGILIGGGISLAMLFFLIWKSKKEGGGAGAMGGGQ